MKLYLEKIMEHENLTFEEMTMAANQLFSPEISDSEMGAFLAALKLKGETAEEIAGLVEVIRGKSLQMDLPFSSIMDNCGTGGDGSGSFNISTTSAFVIAGAGMKIAKHGNRSVSSKTGSADVLEHLGVSLNLDRHQIADILDKNGIAFLFAPNVHPHIKRIMKVRRDLKIPTIFNLIGPLTNPAPLDTQLLGIYRRDMLQMMADVLKQLGRKRALVINGAGYMDEASLSGENHLVLLNEGSITRFVLTPDDVGMPHYEKEAIRGGDSRENADILVRVLKGEEGAYRDTVLLNAGLGIFASGVAGTIKEGIALAKQSIDSGAAMEKLNYLVEYSKHSTKEVI
ncbi:anthranilate phosphoribosyltransferase [Bacillus sp. FJAT-49736]|uniref:anthranilate phosphoribosyltransferase n=1 Tax=Bacillus sp. FJAT-49736 TaxID=2833582 RepID=UPI001BC99B7E|nr:anthranilate phosphoribosyltransferase [Bacillus sp. FJAT-49736]MBS4175151.1 anthranilate phosphoribosyltransferase [Bacillus sp. FJAT-49736]